MRMRERDIVCVCEKDLTCFLKEILIAVRLINGECLVLGSSIPIWYDLFRLIQQSIWL